MAEETIPNESRFDLIWFMVLPGKTEDDAANWLKFAVLEYKNTRMIDPGAFRKAIYRESTGTSKSGTSRRAGVLKNETLIDDKSALWLTKQMTKYAKTLQVPYQIAFDFGTMLTMEYGNDLAAGPDVDPKNVQIAHMSREDEVPGTEMTVRAFLHGFLDKALRGTMEQHRIEAPWKP
ncbi:MAG: hypothetical protein OHK93_007950 [Ramalina farinacea]|uniref:Uncharacterized protein n=1 Tax=Ramalina farinacea TaxID=258253 RepID=A0AA43QNM2_9LECA|nr:hypothetical protein [Ramalina farinacea]